MSNDHQARFDLADAQAAMGQPWLIMGEGDEQQGGAGGAAGVREVVEWLSRRPPRHG